MADDSQKTEEPTEKRLSEALKKGNVAKSPEVTTLAMLLAATGLMALMASDIAGDLLGRLRIYLEGLADLPMDGEGVRQLALRAVWILLLTLAIPFAVFVLAGIVGNLIQAPFTFSAGKIKPDLKKISPLSGLGRIFGPQGWVNLAKGLAKLSIIGAVIFAVMWPEREKLPLLIGMEPSVVMTVIKDVAVRILAACCAVVAVIAVADLAWQKHQRHQKLRMSKQEVKDEHKQSEGDPHVKGRLRQLRQERSRKRMMAAVPEAAVVITNPTHFAVALKYESDTMAAPICVAKGVDAIAHRIRQIAQDHGVPVVENPPLARALHATIELDDPVPPEHYKAVAQVIGYVWRMKSRAKPAGKRP